MRNNSLRCSAVTKLNSPNTRRRRKKERMGPTLDNERFQGYREITIG